MAPTVDDPLSQAWLSMIGNERRTWAGRYDDAVAFLDGWRGAVERTHQITMHLWNRWEESLARGGRGDYAAPSPCSKRCSRRASGSARW